MRRLATTVGIVALAILLFVPVAIVDIIISVPLLAFQKIRGCCEHRPPPRSPADQIRSPVIHASLARVPDLSRRSASFAAVSGRSQIAPSAASSIDHRSLQLFANLPIHFRQRMERLEAFQDAAHSPAEISDDEDSAHSSDNDPSSESDHENSPRRETLFTSQRGPGIAFGNLSSGSHFTRGRLNLGRNAQLDTGGSSDPESPSPTSSVESEALSPVKRTRFSAHPLAPSKRSSHLHGGDADSPYNSDDDVFTLLKKPQANPSALFSNEGSNQRRSPSGSHLYPSRSFGSIHQRISRRHESLSASHSSTESSSASAQSSGSARKGPNWNQKTNTQLPEKLTKEVIGEILNADTQPEGPMSQGVDSKEWLSHAIDNGIKKHTMQGEITLQFSSWDPGSDDTGEIDVFKAFGAWCIVQVLKECHTQLNAVRPLPAFLAGFINRELGRSSLTLSKIMTEFADLNSGKWTLENKAHMILCIEQMQPDLYSQDGVSNEVASYILGIASEAQQGNQAFFEAYSKVYPRIC